MIRLQLEMHRMRGPKLMTKQKTAYEFSKRSNYSVGRYLCKWESKIGRPKQQNMRQNSTTTVGQQLHQNETNLSK